MQLNHLFLACFFYILKLKDPYYTILRDNNIVFHASYLS